MVHNRKEATPAVCRKDTMDFNVILLISLGIVAAIGIPYWLCCGSKLRSIANSLKVLDKELSEKYNAANAADNFEEIAHLCDSNEKMKPMWKIYDKSLVKIHDASQGKHEVYSAAEAEAVFNFENATKDIDLAAWQNLGGIFTGLGILGTFIGLTLGISGIDISSGDVDVLKEGISHLLSGIGTAFITSIVGIGAALLFHFFHSSVVKSLNQAINKIADRMEELFPRKSAEQLMADIRGENEKQTAILASFNTKLATSISDAVNHSLNDSEMSQNIEAIADSASDIKTILEQLNEGIKNMTTSGQDALAETLKTGTNEALSHFSKTLQGLSETITKTVDEMKKSSVSVNDNLRQTIEEISNHLNAVMETNESINKSAQENMDRVEEVMKKYRSGIENTNIQAEKSFKNMTEALTIKIHQMQNTLNDSKDAVTAFRGAAILVSASSQALNRQLESLKKYSEEYDKKIQNGIKTLSETTDKIRSEYNLVSEGVRSINEHWKTYSTQFNNVDKELAKTMRTVNDEMQKYQKTLSSAYDTSQKHYERSLKEYDEKMGQAYSNLSGSIEDLEEAIEKLNNSRRRL